MDELDDAELQAIDDRAERAVPGPWVSLVEGRDHMSGDSFIMTGETGSRGPDLYLSADGHPASPLDQDFVAHCRADVPRLVAEVRRLRRSRAGTE